MLAPRLVLALGLLSLGACKDDPPTAQEDTPEQKRKKQCDRFATDMAQTVMAGDSDEARALRKELLDKCMAWPEDMMECLSPQGAPEGCEERLIAAVDGAAALPEDIPPGPEAAWTFTFESEPRTLGVAEDGTVIAIAGVETDSILAVRDGALAWRIKGDHARWMLALPGSPATWVVAEHNRVLAFDPSTGAERWSATLPAQSDDEGGGAPAIRVATLRGDELWVGDAEARFFALKAKVCAAHGIDCMTSQGRLVGETLDSDVQLRVDAAGRRMLSAGGKVRVFGSDWQRQVTFGAHEGLAGSVVQEGDPTVLLMDDDLIAVDPAKCKSGAIIAPSGWPQPGALVVSESKCKDCQPPPSGCRKWRAHVPGTSFETPALLGDGAVIVGGEEYVFGVHEGTLRFKVALGSGSLVGDGTRVFGVSTPEDGSASLYELDTTTGIPKWRTMLPQEGARILEEDVHIAQGGSWLAMSVEHTLKAWKTPGA